ncbi:MAG: glycine oxidase ThiO [Elusimicrobia bacterium]|nr:glycine oxidase ThiO [Candidatus Obscuribacterium magneticum]
MKTYDDIIIGGGIIGLSTAYELSKRGTRVLLIERNHLGFGASGSSAAMLECQVDAHRGEPFFTLARASNDLFPALHKDILRLTGIDFQYEKSGILQVAITEDDAEFLKSEVQRQNRLKLAAVWVEPDDLRNEYPQINPEHYGGALFQEDGNLNGEKYLAAMAAAARKNGVEIAENMGDLEFIKEGGRINGIRTLRGDYFAERFVLAAGAWTDVLLQPLGFRLGIEPIRGQLLVYDTPVRPFPRPLYTRSNGYITPKEGYTFVGTTVEHVGFVNTTTPEAKEELRQKAVALIPKFSRLTQRGMTSGLRPGSPDMLPIIGALPDHPQLIVATGHYRNGILLSPITAQIIADLISNKTPRLNLQPFSTDRFLVNKYT